MAFQVLLSRAVKKLLPSSRCYLAAINGIICDARYGVAL